MPFFKERVEEYCEKYTLQEARLTGSKVKDPSDLPDVEPGKGVLAKTVSQSPNTDTEKQRLQQSISVYSEDHPDSNALVKVCASNIANSRIESLRMIDLVKDYKGKSEQERIEEIVSN